MILEGCINNVYECLSVSDHLQARFRQGEQPAHPHHLQHHRGEAAEALQHHLRGGPRARGVHRGQPLQVRHQLPVALQAKHPHRRMEKEDHPLRGGRRLRQQGRQDQPSRQKDDLMCSWGVHYVIRIKIK